MSYAYVWEFVVRPEAREEFLEAYSSGGTWETLFQKDDRFLETEFLGDVNDEYRFMTVDHWESKDAMEAFLVKYAEEYKKIDDKCESFTESENYLGEFQPKSAGG